MKELITKGDHARMVDHTRLGKAFELSIPTPEHYLPLLYTLGLQQKADPIHLFNDRTVMGSIAMTSVKIG